MALSLLAGSCTNFLEPYPNGDISDQDLWKYQERVQGLVGQAYEGIALNYNDNEGAFLDGATDDAAITVSTHVMRRLATGTITTSQDPFRTYWDRAYRAINLVNTFLKDRRGYNTKYLTNVRFNELVRNRLQGEAFALRAWHQWDLLQKFGGKGANGAMLGFPIVLEPYDVRQDMNRSRNTYDECVQQIIADCDSAFKYLPIAHRDFLVPNVTDRAYAGGKYWGRFDGITTVALKAMVYLTWASPRFNPTNAVARWDSAAVNAKKVMDFKLTTDAVANGFKPTDGVNWLNPNSPEIIFTARYTNTNDAMERIFYPGGFQGNGQIGASQELVNAFPMANGYPITDPRSGYNPQNPYVNRDPRFYSVIFYNTAAARRNNTGEVMYTFENWSNGGKDRAGVSSTNSLTNYHIKKYVNMALNWSDNVINRQPHAKFFIRWAHMCLTFAEAANQVAGPTDAAKYGLSARDAIAYLRKRNTYNSLPGITTDPYLAEAAGEGKEAFNSLIRNERRIETCFEGMRFYDIRRWSTTLTELNKEVNGADIVRAENGTFTYNLNSRVESRVYTSAYLPIPYTEILRMSNLVQNEGWDGWN